MSEKFQKLWDMNYSILHENAPDKQADRDLFMAKFAWNVCGQEILKRLKKIPPYDNEDEIYNLIDDIRDGQL